VDGGLLYWGPESYVNEGWKWAFLSIGVPLRNLERRFVYRGLGQGKWALCKRESLSMGGL
jgi:hypothetical protein